jgi:hypothetical protein
MSVIKWKEFAETSSTGRGSNPRENIDFLKVKGGNTYKVRPVGTAVEITKVFNRHNDRIRCVVIDHGSDEGQGMLDKLESEYGLKGDKKYVVNVLHRDDGNKLKIYEGPKSVFEVFADWSTENEIEPGSKDGIDFSIKVKGDGLERRYTVIPGQATPFTDEEKAEIKEKMIDGNYDLDKVYKANDTDQIEKILFGSPDSEGGTEKAAVAAAAGSGDEVLSDKDLGF